MAGAKDSVASTVSGVVDKTKEAVTGSVERTKSVVNGSINTVLGMVRLVNSRIDNAITKLELLVDQYFPLTQKELGN
jgi:perilipin-2